MIEVSIVSGTYNRLPLLKKMIASVRRSIAGSARLAYEIILVDGGSTDGTLEYLRQQPDVRLIEQGQLLGAIKAFGDGAAAAQGEYVIFANDDLEFVSDAIRRAVTFMRANPDVGIGTFWTDRAGRGLHVDQMPAHWPDGRMTSVPYGGIIITPRWLGQKLEWWALEGARTYGGDNAMCARGYEAGFPTVPIPDAVIHEVIPGDQLNQINNVPQNDSHPDTAAYLSKWPNGPELGKSRLWTAPLPALRVLYCPIYEPGHKIQHQQKRGLRRALQRVAIVRELDYLAYEKNAHRAIWDQAESFKPHVILTQFHDANRFGLDHTIGLRNAVPQAKLINWNGDVYDRSGDAAYVEMLKLFDLHLVVNADAAANFNAAGVKSAYWQIGYEPDGVGAPPNREQFDVVFLGNNYSDQRTALANMLLATGYNVGLFGRGMPSSRGTNTYDFAAGCGIMKSSKLVIGDDQYQATGFVSNRFFQALAAGGGLLLHQRVPGIETLLGLVDEHHYVAWDDFRDLRAKMDYYLDPAHEEERLRIIHAGQLECLKFHSFEARVRQLLDLIVRSENMVPGVRPDAIPVEYV